MPKELNGLSDRVLPHWFPTGKSSHVGVGRRPNNEGFVEGTEPNQNEVVI